MRAAYRRRCWEARSSDHEAEGQRTLSPIQQLVSNIHVENVSVSLDVFITRPRVFALFPCASRSQAHPQLTGIYCRLSTRAMKGAQMVVCAPLKTATGPLTTVSRMPPWVVSTAPAVQALWWSSWCVMWSGQQWNSFLEISFQEGTSSASNVDCHADHCQQQLSSSLYALL